MSINLLNENDLHFDSTNSQTSSDLDEQCCIHPQKLSNLKVKEYYVTIDIDNLSDDSREPVSDSDDSDQEEEIKNEIEIKQRNKI